MDHRRILALIAPLFALLTACAITPDEADVAQAANPRLDVYFNSPATRPETGSDANTDDVLVQTLDRARTSIDMAVYGFSRRPVIEAAIRAHNRGVRVRIVGDAKSNTGYTGGYLDMDRLNIPMQTGNQNHIMHNKFFIIDEQRVFVGTGNITSNSFDRDNNAWVIIDSPAVARDFTAEFEQMFAGRFGAAKVRLENGESYPVGDTRVEVRFAPEEDALGRLLQAINEAQSSVRFFIFAFTKDSVGSALIAKHREFTAYNQFCDPALNPVLVEAGGQGAAADAHRTLHRCGTAPFARKLVQGVVDRSQLHSNGPYHEFYRLLTAGVDVVLDGNENAGQPGDYQAGGARQHDKTIVIDGGLPTAKVCTGSFNWSSSATGSNDETLLVLEGERLTALYVEQFERLYAEGDLAGNRYVGDGTALAPGDIVFNEIQWDGYNGTIDPTDAGGDDVYNDEFIELLNTTDEAIDISLWTIATDDDFVLGFYPGTIIGPRERFLVVDHNLAPFQDGVPQTQVSAYRNADFIMNVSNDPRFLRLSLHNLDFRLRLLDPRGTEFDRAGDGGPAFFGGREASGTPARNFSMERIHTDCSAATGPCARFTPGDSPAAWRACSAAKGGANVNDAFQSYIIATPGEPNSGGEFIAAEPADFRSPGSGAP